jgi:hypothetical protein
MKRNLLACGLLLLAAGCDWSGKEAQAKAEQGQRESDQNATRVERVFDQQRAQLDQDANEKRALTKVRESVREADRELVEAGSALRPRPQAAK